MSIPQSQDFKFIDGRRVTADLYPKVMQIKQEAESEGVLLLVASGLRLKMEQFDLRKANVIDKSKVSDFDYILEADNGLFNPRTAKPGTSNHEFGIAMDFGVNGKPKVYAWLVRNALRFGWVRTVPSERWHWEYRPECKDKFQFVPKDHPTWDGLI